MSHDSDSKVKVKNVTKCDHFLVFHRGNNKVWCASCGKIMEFEEWKPPVFLGGCNQ